MLKHRELKVWMAVLCVGALAGAPTVLAQTTWYVATNGVGGGLGGWAEATNSLPGAIRAAAGGDTVLVSNGVYISTGAMGNRAMLNITNGITVRSLGGCGETVLDGNAPAVENRVVHLGHPAAVLEGFTITRGLAVGGSQAFRYGGGVIITNGGALRDCLITGNAAGRTNSVGGRGGGVYVCSASAALISDCIISNNVTDTDALGGSTGGTGGGVCIDGSDDGEHAVEIANSRIIHNLCGGAQGGGLYAARGVFTGCLIAWNQAPSTALHCGFAGGMTLSATAEARNCVIASNYAYKVSGVRMYYGGLLRNCLIEGNSSDTEPAIYFSQNGGMQNCTAVNNINSNGLTGGIQITQTGGLISLENNIIWMNHAPNGTYSNYYRGSGTVTASNNCIGSTSGDFHLDDPAYGNINTPPLFVDEVGDYRLQAPSPCINAGYTHPWMQGAVDLAGHRRLDWVAGVVDMGCYEYAPPGTLIQSR